MIERVIETSQRELITIHDDATGDVHTFELETGVCEQVQPSILNQQTAQLLITQEQAELQPNTYNRRRIWGACAVIGVAAAAINASVSLILDSDKYSTGTILGGSSIFAGILTSIGIMGGEFVNKISKPAVEAKNKAVHDRISILQSYANQQ